MTCSPLLLQWAAHSITVQSCSPVKRGLMSPGKALCTFHTSIQTSLLLSCFIICWLLFDIRALRASPPLWGLGAGAQGPENRRGMWRSPSENVEGDTTRAEPSWGFLLTTLLSLATRGQDKREGICPFGSSWNLVRASSIYKSRNAKAIPLKSSTRSGGCRHINLKPSCLRCKPSTVTASD